ncbi:MAG: crossover junction endodeoxyribonuclease RuvC [bacterium]|nr:crossover junction endodeoxyribonuclease RuvC [bacterium]
MLVMGFDPGSIRFGIGVLKKEKGRIVYIHSEVITLKEADFNLKMKTLWQRLHLLCNKFPIDTAAIEEGFLGKNVKSMNVLAKVRGVVLGSMIVSDIPLHSYSPRQVKQALTGSGGALKTQVAKMVRTLLNIDEKKMSADESDALAVAYCHALSIRG